MSDIKQQKLGFTAVRHDLVMAIREYRAFLADAVSGKLDDDFTSEEMDTEIEDNATAIRGLRSVFYSYPEEVTANSLDTFNDISHGAIKGF